MAVARDQRAIEADFARHSGGNDLELGAHEVLFSHLVGLLEVRDEAILVGLGIVARLVALLGLRVGRPREHVEIFGGIELVARLLGLIVAEVRKNVADEEHGIAFLVADLDLHLRAVLADDRAVERERPHEPLVLLDAAIHVAVEIDVAALLVDRFRLEVETRRVGVAADDLDANFGDLLLADHCRHDRTVFIAAVNLVASLERLEGGNLLEAALFKKPHALGVAAALRFSNAQIAHVFCAVGVHLHVLHFHGAYYTKSALACEASRGGLAGVVGLAGIGPATPTLKVSCSTN